MTPAEKLQKLIPPPAFNRWLSRARFTENGLSLPSGFLADWVRGHFEQELFAAFGFYPEITVEEAKAAPALIERPAAEVVPIEKARRPERGFVARELVILNLPHSDPKAPVWVRRNGRVSLIVQGGYRSRAGEIAPEYVGIPYGATARLILFYLMTEAMLTKSRKIYLGSSFDAFLETIGATKESRGKKSGSQAALRQLDRLLNASFRIQHEGESEEAEAFRVKTLPMAESYEIWFSKKNKENGQATLWASYVELSKELYESLIKAPVPLDWDILLKLRKSPLALDLYAWLSYESARAWRAQKGRFVPWAALKDQMGAEYATVKEFSRKAKAELSKISKLYSDLKVTTPRGGIAISADSLPSVSRQELPPK